MYTVAWEKSDIPTTSTTCGSGWELASKVKKVTLSRNREWQGVADYRRNLDRKPYRSKKQRCLGEHLERSLKRLEISWKGTNNHSQVHPDNSNNSKHHWMSVTAEMLTLQALWTGSQQISTLDKPYSWNRQCKKEERRKEMPRRCRYSNLLSWLHICILAVHRLQNPINNFHAFFDI